MAPRCRDGSCLKGRSTGGTQGRFVSTPQGRRAVRDDAVFDHIEGAAVGLVDAVGDGAFADDRLS